MGLSASALVVGFSNVLDELDGAMLDELDGALLDKLDGALVAALDVGLC